MDDVCGVKSMTYKLTYFDIPALGEPLRLLLHLADLQWEDNAITFKEWPELKPKSKWGQLPMMITPQGKEMAQTKALARYLAKLASLDGEATLAREEKSMKLYPEDPMLAYDVDEIVETFEDIRSKLAPTFAIQDQAEKEAARAKLFEKGEAADDLLCKLEAHVGTEFATGDKATLADIWIFWFCSFLRSGFWDGLPKDFLDKFPKLSGIVDKIRNEPRVREYYARKDKETKPMYAAFQP